MGFIQLGSPGGCHALDLLETTVDCVPLVLHLGGVKSTAGHQTVGLAVQVLQTVLGRGHKGKGQKTGSPIVICLKIRTQAFFAVRLV